MVGSSKLSVCCAFAPSVSVDEVDAGLHREARRRERDWPPVGDAVILSVPLTGRVAGERRAGFRSSPAECPSTSQPDMNMTNTKPVVISVIDVRLAATRSRSTVAPRRIATEHDRADDDRDVAVRGEEDARDVEDEDDEAEHDHDRQRRAA